MVRSPIRWFPAVAVAVALTTASCATSPKSDLPQAAPTTVGLDVPGESDARSAQGEPGGQDESGSGSEAGDPGRSRTPIPPSLDPDARNDDQWHDAAARTGPDPQPASDHAAACRETAGRPLAPQPSTGDPLAELTSGTTASVYGSEEPLDEVMTFDSLADYRDPSTPHDLDALVAAWEEAGFAGGVVAKRDDEYGLVMASAIEFASPEDARAAVSAHLVDLCHRAVHSIRHADDAGMTMLRESGAVRSVEAVDRFEISLFVCVCVGRDADERIAAVEDWRNWLVGRWSGTAPETYEGNERV